MESEVITQPMEKEALTEFECERIMIDVPAETLELEVIATIWYNGETKKATRKLTFQEVREAMKDAAMNYIAPDDKFTLTGKGLAAFGNID